MASPAQASKPTVTTRGHSACRNSPAFGGHYGLPRPSHWGTLRSPPTDPQARHPGSDGLPRASRGYSAWKNSPRGCLRFLLPRRRCRRRGRRRCRRRWPRRRRPRRRRRRRRRRRLPPPAGAGGPPLPPAGAGGPVTAAGAMARRQRFPLAWAFAPSLARTMCARGPGRPAWPRGLGGLTGVPPKEHSRLFWAGQEET